MPLRYANHGDLETIAKRTAVFVAASVRKTEMGRKILINLARFSLILSRVKIIYPGKGYIL